MVLGQITSIYKKKFIAATHFAAKYQNLFAVEAIVHHSVAKGTPKSKQPICSPNHLIAPQTPQSSTPTAATPRRSLRLTSETPQQTPLPPRPRNSPHSAVKSLKSHEKAPPNLPILTSRKPASPQPTESRRKRIELVTFSKREGNWVVHGGEMEGSGEGVICRFGGAVSSGFSAERGGDSTDLAEEARAGFGVR